MFCLEIVSALYMHLPGCAHKQCSIMAPSACSLFTPYTSRSKHVGHWQRANSSRPPPFIFFFFQLVQTFCHMLAEVPLLFMFLLGRKKVSRLPTKQLLCSLSKKIFSYEMLIEVPRALEGGGGIWIAPWLTHRRGRQGSPATILAFCVLLMNIA